MTQSQPTLDEREIARVARAMRDPECVFVFGSNYAGIHGAGAALTAAKLYGARPTFGQGISGRAYGIPTKRTPWDRLTLRAIGEHVRTFVAYASAHPELHFAVTRVGCGRAGYTDADMAPLFADAPGNCLLPEGWRDWHDAHDNPERKARS